MFNTKFFFVLLLLLHLILIGCVNNTDPIDEEFLTKPINQIKNSGSHRIKKVRSDVSRIRDKQQSDFLSHSKYYNINVEIKKVSLRGNELVHVSVKVDKPTDMLNNMSLTFVMDDELFHYFYTTELFNSNITVETSLFPNGKTPGFYVGKTFSILPDGHVLKKENMNKEDFSTLLKKIHIRTSWQDKEGNIIEEYIKLSDDNISIYEDVFFFLD